MEKYYETDQRKFSPDIRFLKYFWLNGMMKLHKSVCFRLSSLWENDISVHSLTLPSTTCLELLLILSKSNATLPPSLRCMNSFQVRTGSLRVSFLSLTCHCVLRILTFIGTAHGKLHFHMIINIMQVLPSLIHSK